jgi:adenylate kinase
MVNIVLLGPPGSGKGTQAIKLENYYGVKKISVGDMLRKVAEEETVLGIKVKNIINSGCLVEDGIIIDVVKNRIAEPDCSQGVIFDGVPRTLQQAIMLDKMLSDIGTEVDVALEFVVEQQELVNRILSRINCVMCGASYNKHSKRDGIKCDQCESVKYVCRADDQVDKLMVRLDVYNNQVSSLIEYYTSSNILVKVDGMDSTDSIFEQIKIILSERAIAY